MNFVEILKEDVRHIKTYGFLEKTFLPNQETYAIIKCRLNFQMEDR